MLPSFELTPTQARNIALTSQGLHKPNAFGKGVQGVNAAINHLSYLQIDSISVVQRAHHHCLWSRVSNYQIDFIQQLMAQKQIFEYWSHAAAYLPMQDYRFSLFKKQAIAGGEKHWRDKDPVAEKRVLKRIQQEGPLRAKDFEHNKTKKTTGWWDWKPDKVALEQLFIEGELMVIERCGFQKVYDLTERVLPDCIDTSVPNENEFSRYLITRYLQAHGFGNVQQICYLRRGLTKPVKQACEDMLENNELQYVFVGQHIYYSLPKVTDLLKRSVSRKQVNILSPFDNVVIQRKRLLDIFGFDYQIECYVPPGKRQYGYFSLPLLWADKFAGSIDLKIDRKTHIFHVQNLHLETDNVDEFIEVLKPSLYAFMQFNNGKQIQVHNVSSCQPLSQNKQADIKQRLQALSFI